MAQIKTNLQYGVTGTVQSANVADDAITSAKLADDSVVAAAIADNAVVTAAINADAITAAKVADDIINSEHIAAGGIDTEHIADDQITLAKMASGTDGNVITYDASGNPAVVAVGTSGHFLKSQGAGSVPVFAADNKGKVGQIVWDDLASSYTTTSTSYADTGLSISITPSASSSYIWVLLTFGSQLYGNNSTDKPDGDIQITDGSNTELAVSRIREMHETTTHDSHDVGAVGAYYTTGGTSAETIKVRLKARYGRIALYDTSAYKNTTTLTAMEILA